jgi:hypothetical protein
VKNNLCLHLYTHPSFYLTVQWQAWLRHNRTVAPTIEDLIKDERRIAIVQGRAKVLEEEWAKVKDN